MQIEGPIRFSVAQEDTSAGYELFLDFNDAFQALDLEQQEQTFRSYLAGLGQLLNKPGLDERNRQGMFIVQQIAEQLLPHVCSGELALNETINIHVRPNSPEVSLVNLLRQP